LTTDKLSDARPRSASTAWVDALAATAGIAGNPHRLIHHHIAEQAALSPASPALLSDRERLSFSDLASQTRSYASWALAQGLGRGDHVALVMSNRPEFVAIWLGLSSQGVVTALINVNLTGASLTHCLAIAQPSHVIVESSLMDAVIACGDGWMKALPAQPKIWRHGEGEGPRIEVERNDEGTVGIACLPVVSIDDPALLIYTSGTTGLPKAAYVSHRRVLNWALWFKGLLGNTATDRMYNCLPLYHSVGGVVAVMATLVAGGSTVIAEKFSARRFWDDIRRWECTQFQYIGELCRYLLAAPASDRDGQHRLRVICGNGLRADVWESFKARFAIPQIVEFYAATEGSFSLFNAEGKPGAIGRIPSYLRHRFPTALVRHDFETGLPLRRADGFCVRADVGEAGEAIGKIGGGGDGTGRFEGYTDPVESDRKVLRNVFETGDAWFRTGDLMRVDGAGYYYFVDRIGDTFRWKGENVSTLEVANVVAAAPGVKDAVVYGVSVPGQDGRAGMALLDVAEGFDAGKFFASINGQLPPYAMPLFLRLGEGADLTETFKHKKQALVQQGFDPAATDDAIYVFVAGAQGYQRLDDELYRKIAAGAVRL
jgi:fatty-acyl-CoA synthase